MSLYSRAFSKCVQIGERSGSNLFLRRLFSADAKQPIPIVKYEEILDLPNQPQKTLIDVREPEELKETGAIPCSINIPLGSVADELKQRDDAFARKYNRKKPSLDAEVIFSCLSGRRSEMAALSAREIGFTNVKNYLGSWTEYAARQNLPTKK